MKQALLFYGNTENYIQHKKYKEPSLIELDEGNQARFALEQLQKLDDLNEEMGEEYIKLVSKELEKNQSPEGIMKLIKEIKNLKDDQEPL